MLISHWMPYLNIFRTVRYFSPRIWAVELNSSENIIWSGFCLRGRSVSENTLKWLTESVSVPGLMDSSECGARGIIQYPHQKENVLPGGTATGC